MPIRERSRLWGEVQRCQTDLAEAIRVHGEGSAQAQVARSRYRDVSERYRMALIRDFEGDALDHISRGE